MRIAIFSDAAFIDKDQARRHLLGETHFMSDDNHGHSFFRQVLHHLQHFMAQLRVERGGRLVKQHHFRFYRQRARNGDALLLAARQL